MRHAKQYSHSDLDLLSPSYARKQAKILGIPRNTTHGHIHSPNRPECNTSGCDNLCVELDWHWTTGIPRYRKVCLKCHTARIKEINDGDSGASLSAKRKGLTTIDYQNQFHPTRRFRKTYCENIDGRLNFYCTTNVMWSGMLDTDHIDGNPSNQEPSNHQTLCKCCHAYKTNINKDYASPGRTKLKIKY